MVIGWEIENVIYLFTQIFAVTLLQLKRLIILTDEFMALKQKEVFEQMYYTQRSKAHAGTDIRVER